MDVKLIAVDMDGTFLSTGHGYNVERFQNVFKQLQERKIQFVVASGNQYYQISSFFDSPDIWYAAENGAWIRNQSEELFVASMDLKEAIHLVDELKKHKEIRMCVCGKHSAYVEDEILVPEMSECFPHIKVVESLHDIDDQLFKLALVTPMNKTQEIYEAILAMIPNTMEVVQSGFGCIDINIKGIHKGYGLQLLCDRLHIPFENCMAFGDSGNDVEMLKRVGYAYAMENASDQVKAITKLRAPSCANEGVLEIIEQYLAGKL